MYYMYVHIYIDKYYMYILYVCTHILIYTYTYTSTCIFAYKSTCSFLLMKMNIFLYVIGYVIDLLLQKKIDFSS